MTEKEYPLDGKAVTTTLLNLAVESWRFGRSIDRLLARLDMSEQRKAQRQLRWFQKQLEESLAGVDMRIVSIEGQVFDPGMAASPLNIEDFDAKDTLVVDQMLEPIVMGSDGVVRTGTVTLKKI